MTSAFQFFFPEQGVAAIRETSLSKPVGSKVLVETLYGGISRGTERLVFDGMVPEDSWECMKCPNQFGDFSFPVSYGYACVGRIAAIGPEVENLSVDDLVFSLHPHHTHFLIDGQQTTKIPGSLRPDVAVLSANMETALNAIWDAQLRATDNALVVGAGVVGLLAAFLASSEGAEVVISDINPNRRQIAEALGLSFAPPNEIGAGDDEYAVIFNTAASEKGLQLAIDKAAFEARIVEMSWYGTKPVSLMLGGAFHSKRLTIISSQVGSVAPAKRDAFTHSERLTLAMEKLVDPRLGQLLNPRIAFRELPEVLPDMLNPSNDALCPLIEYK